MGFLDFFKKLSGKEKTEPEIEKIGFKDINSWLKNKKKQVESQNQELLDLIKKEITKTVSELNEKIPVLENVDIEKYKEQARVKIIVKENLGKYISDVQTFKKSLEDLQEATGAGKIISDIDNLVEDFQKRTSMSFQKATILVGKELGAIRDCIKNFLANTRKVISENKESLDKIKIIINIENNLSEKNKLEKQKQDLATTISENNSEIEEIEKEIKIIEQDIQEIKTSEGYLAKQEKNKEFENLKEKLDIEIINLKKLIDFKELASFFHTNHKEMEFVKAHKENFSENFQKDNGRVILKLLEESKQASSEIMKKISEVTSLKQEIENMTPFSETDDVEKLNQEIMRKQDKIEHLNIEKIKETKRNEKIDNNIAGIFYSIKDNLEKISVKIIVDV